MQKSSLLIQILLTSSFALSITSCGERGAEISNLPDPMIIEISGPVTFIGGAVTDGNVDDSDLTLWISSLEEIFFDHPDNLTFKAEPTAFNTASGLCETAELGVTCPFSLETDISLGIGLAARVEDPRGIEGNWVTTVSAFMAQEQLIALREEPTDTALPLGPFVLARSILNLMSASLERDSEDLERLGAGLFLVTTATGEAVSGVRISHTSKRGYQIVYANDFGLPDLNLEETSESGAVFIVPTDDIVRTHILPIVMTTSGGEAIETQAMIPRSTFILFPLFVP